MSFTAEAIDGAGEPVSFPCDAVLFDAGGVLVLPDPTVIAPLLAPLGGDPSIGAHRRAHYAAMAAKSKSGSHEGVWGDYDAAYVDAVGVDPAVRDHAAYLLHVTRTPWLFRWPIPETLAALARWQAAGVPMGVVSNASGQIEEELHRARVCQVGPGDGIDMRVVVDSEVVGLTKPDPRIFDVAIAAFSNIPRDRIVYIGDSVTMDIGGARAAGLTAVLLDPYDDHVGADFLRVGSVADLLPSFA